MYEPLWFEVERLGAGRAVKDVRVLEVEEGRRLEKRLGKLDVYD